MNIWEAKLRKTCQQKGHPHSPSLLFEISLGNDNLHTKQAFNHETTLVHPGMGDRLGWKSFGESPGLHLSSWGVSHLQPLSLELPYLWTTEASDQQKRGVGIACWGGGYWEKKGRDTAPRQFVLALYTLIYSHGRQLSRRFSFPKRHVYPNVHHSTVYNS